MSLLNGRQRIADAQGASHGHAVMGSQSVQVADAALRDVAPDRHKLCRVLRAGERRLPADEPNRPCRWGHSCSIYWTLGWRTLAAAHPDYPSIPAYQFRARIWQHDLLVCVWRRHRGSAGTLALPRLLSFVRYRCRSCLRTQFIRFKYTADRRFRGSRWRPIRLLAVPAVRPRDLPAWPHSASPQGLLDHLRLGNLASRGSRQPSARWRCLLGACLGA